MSTLCLFLQHNTRNALRHQNQLHSTYSLRTLFSSYAHRCSTSVSHIFSNKDKKRSYTTFANVKHWNNQKYVVQNTQFNNKECMQILINAQRTSLRSASSNQAEKVQSQNLTEEIFCGTSKLSLFKKFKLMYKNYWYVLIPVHIVTSIGWMATFYYLSKSGVDVPALLNHIHLSENIIQKVQNSEMGHIAIAYLCFKIATPLRYALTLGGTTVSIKYLVLGGYIKPVPCKKQLMEMYEQKKANMKDASKNVEK